MLSRILTASAAACLLWGAQARADMFVGSVETVIPAARFQTLMLPIFPDGSLFGAAIGSRTYFFAAEGGARDSADQGTIILGNHGARDGFPQTTEHSLSTLVPLWTTANGSPISSLRPGYQDPPPDGNDGGFPAGVTFDRDYAGGGPTYYSPGFNTIIQIYHGEYHPAYPAGQPFYTSLGLAVSFNFNSRFHKLGLAIRPEIPPDQPIPPNTSIPTVPSSSGSLVRVGDYFYLYYSDLSPDGTCAGLSSQLKNVPCIAVARAKVASVLYAAQQGVVSPWLKYYHDGFTEPGKGGRFSPLIVTAGHTWVRWPMVVYEPRGKTFLMTDVLVEAGQTLKTAVELRESKDGLTWGPPTEIAVATAPQELNYPSIVPLDSGDRDARGDAGDFERAGGTKFKVLFVLEQNSAQLGKPYTRDLEGVDVTSR